MRGKEEEDDEDEGEEKNRIFPFFERLQTRRTNAIMLEIDRSIALAVLNFYIAKTANKQTIDVHEPDLKIITRMIERGHMLQVQTNIFQNQIIYKKKKASKRQNDVHQWTPRHARTPQGTLALF